MCPGTLKMKGAKDLGRSHALHGESIVELPGMHDSSGKSSNPSIAKFLAWGLRRLWRPRAHDLLNVPPPIPISKVFSATDLNHPQHHFLKCQ